MHAPSVARRIPPAGPQAQLLSTLPPKHLVVYCVLKTQYNIRPTFIVAWETNYASQDQPNAVKAVGNFAASVAWRQVCSHLVHNAHGCEVIPRSRASANYVGIGLSFIANHNNIQYTDTLLGIYICRYLLSKTC